MRIRLTAAILMIGAAVAWADKKFDDTVKKADEQLRKGKQEDALKRIQKLAEQQSGNPEAYLVLSRLHERLGNLDEAGQALTAALAAATGNTRAAVLAAQSRFDLRTSSGQQALRHAEEAVEISANATTLAALARARVRVGDYAGARDEAEKALALDGRSLLAQLALGEAELGLERPADAVETLQKAISSAPTSACTLCAPDLLNLARTRLALAMIGSGRAPEAITVARQASEADQQSGEAFAALAAAIHAEDDANWSDAIAQAQMGTFVDPKSVLVRVAVAKLFEAGGNPQQAEANYRMALQVDPAYAPAQIGLIQVQVRRDDLDGALAEVNKLVEMAPQSGDAQLMLGEILIRKNQFAEAVAPLEIAVKNLPGRAQAHAMLGFAAQRMGRYEQAAEAFREAVKLDPENIDYQETLGLYLGLAGKHEEGAEVLKKVTSTPGYDDSAGFTNLGWIYRNMDPRRPKESAAAYKKALELDPKNVQAAIGMGWAYMYAEEYDTGIAAFNQAIQIDEKVAGEAYYGIARCHYFKEDMDQADAAVKQAQQAGRNVNGLVEAIAKYRNAVKENEDNRAAAIEAAKKWERAEALVRQLRDSKSTQSRVDAARALASIDAEFSVDPLIWALQEDDREVRMAACEALGRIGPAAKKALPMLRHLAQAQPPDKVIMDKEEMQQQWFDNRIKSCAQQSIRKIQR